MIDAVALAGPDEFEELMFEGPDAFAPVAPTKPAPEPAAGRKRISRKAPQPVPQAPPASEPAAAAEPPAAAAPEPTFPPPRPKTLPAWLALAALGVGLLAALLAAIGLLLMARTAAHADAEAQAAGVERALLARLPASLARLDDVIAREQAALARLGEGRAGQPATIGDMHRELDGLRLALDRHQPQQDLRTIAIVRAGQSEIAERLGTMSDVLDRVDRAGRAAK